MPKLTMNMDNETFKKIEQLKKAFNQPDEAGVICASLGLSLKLLEYAGKDKILTILHDGEEIDFLLNK